MLSSLILFKSCCHPTTIYGFFFYQLFYLLSTAFDETFPLQSLKKQEAETNKPHPPYNIFLQARHYCILQADKDIFTLFLAKCNITKELFLQN